MATEAGESESVLTDDQKADYRLEIRQLEAKRTKHQVKLAHWRTKFEEGKEQERLAREASDKGQRPLNLVEFDDDNKEAEPAEAPRPGKSIMRESPILSVPKPIHPPHVPSAPTSGVTVNVVPPMRPPKQEIGLISAQGSLFCGRLQPGAEDLRRVPIRFG